MRTIIIKVDENSKKGKAYFSEEVEVQLIAIDGVPIKMSSESDLKFVSESRAKYKTPRISKKVTKKNADTEESPYNPEFVKMVLDAEKSKNRTRVTAATL